MFHMVSGRARFIPSTHTKKTHPPRLQTPIATLDKPTKMPHARGSVRALVPHSLGVEWVMKC